MSAEGGSAKRFFREGRDDSVANVSLIVAIDKVQLIERVGKLTARKLERVLAGVDVVLGR